MRRNSFPVLDVRESDIQESWVYAAELDVLSSLAIASDYYEGSTCRLKFINSGKFPCLSAKSLGHPVLRSDTLGKGAFVPDDVTISGPASARFILLTGPSIAKLLIVQQALLYGKLTPGYCTQSLSSLTNAPSAATFNSLVALDELGRGTSTSDGQAIAEAVLHHFVHSVQFRGMFSTHYHHLAVKCSDDPGVSLCHMACQVGDRGDSMEEVTFLYMLMSGACPKSYGINVARLAGIPESIFLRAAIKSREFEESYGRQEKLPQKNPCMENRGDDILPFVRELIRTAQLHNSRGSSTMDSLHKLQHEVRIFLRQH